MEINTAQSQLSFNLPEETHQKPKDRSQEKHSKSNASVVKKKIRVEELTRHSQDLEILRMGKAFCNDTDLNEHVDDDVLLMSCIKVRQDVDRQYVNCFIAYADTTPVGFLVGVTTPAFHRLGIVAEQKLCYVEPTARGGYAVVRLIKAFERWSRINGATQIFTGTANLRYAERTSKLLEHFGYARVGALHVKEI